MPPWCPTLVARIPFVLVLVAFAMMVLATMAPALAAPSKGSLHVRDEAGGDAPGNDPHVSCSFWLRGEGLPDGPVDLLFRTWPPGGDGTQVATATATGPDFLAGPFTLAPGHYRVEAATGDAGKSKTFWVDACAEPSPSPSPTSTPSPTPSPSPTPEPSPSSSPSPTASASPTPEPSPTSSPSSTASPSPTPEPSPTSSPSPTPSPSTSPISSTSSTASPTPPPAPALACPTDLRARHLDNGTVLVTFTPTPGSAGTQLLRQAAGGGWVLLATLGPGIDRFWDEDVSADTAYSYEARALGDAGGAVDCPAVHAVAVPDLGSALAIGLGLAGAVVPFVVLSRRRAR